MEILWRYHCGETIAEIMPAVKMTRKSVGKWIERALAMGVEAALKTPIIVPARTVSNTCIRRLTGPG